LTETLHKLAALRLLSNAMSGLEIRRLQRIEHGDDDLAAVDRETAQEALNGVVMFFLDHGVEAAPLVRLLGELAALTAGSASRMLAPAAIAHRRPDPPSIEGIKGRLAAIMEFRQQAGMSRKAARQWVVRHIPSHMKLQLGPVTASTVDSWLVKWGGERRAAPGSGRDGYRHTRAILESQIPTEQRLETIIRALEKSLPS
jgi:hypothetical protein